MLLEIVALSVLLPLPEPLTASDVDDTEMHLLSLVFLADTVKQHSK